MVKLFSSPKIALGIVMGAALVASSLSVNNVLAVAPVKVWDGGTDTNYNFSQAENWVGDVAPVDGDALEFPMSVADTLKNPVNDVTTRFAGLHVSGPGTGSLYKIGGSTMYLSGAVKEDSKGSTWIDAPIALTDYLTNEGIPLGDVNVGTYAFVTSGQVGVLSGSGPITVPSGSSPIFNKANTFTGPLTINGTLTVYNQGNLGAGSVNVASGGVLKFAGALGGTTTIDKAITFNGPATGGALLVNAGGTAGKGGSDAVTNYQFNNVTLKSDINFKAYGDATGAADATINIKGNLGNFTVKAEAGSVGKLTVGEQSVVQPPVENIEIAKDQIVASVADVQDNQVLTVKGTITNLFKVLSGGVLKGIGTVAGGFVAESGSVVAPGLSPGVLNSGDVTFNAGSVLEEELAGTTAGQYDQLNVTGSVSLGNATLRTVLFGGYVPAVGDSYTIINNDGTDAVVGTFAGVADDSTFAANGVTYNVNYNGGDGNDVVLTVTAVAATVGVPNTGFERLANPLLPLAVAGVLGAGVLIAGRRHSRR